MEIKKKKKNFPYKYKRKIPIPRYLKIITTKIYKETTTRTFKFIY